jgi:hypothetical protein
MAKTIEFKYAIHLGENVDDDWFHAKNKELSEKIAHFRKELKDIEGDVLRLSIISEQIKSLIANQAMVADAHVKFLERYDGFNSKL